MLLLLLTLGNGIGAPKPPAPNFVTFKATNSEETPAPEPEQKAATEPTKTVQKVAPQPQAKPVALPPAPVPATPVKPAVNPAKSLIALSPQQMASADISGKPAAAPKQAYGPVNSGSPGDSQRVSGTAPNGEPLYRASWYREPSQDELAGYLSTATGPGWALISCRTVADFRVEDCVLESEFPPSSNMGRAVLAAAWQFRVRPPRVGGRPLVGAWVRIRIEYARR
ncbi:MAG: hypothetical protein WAT93_10675 [Pontixanthobacter sp.]